MIQVNEDAEDQKIAQENLLRNIEAKQDQINDLMRENTEKHCRLSEDMLRLKDNETEVRQTEEWIETTNHNLDEMLARKQEVESELEGKVDQHEETMVRMREEERLLMLEKNHTHKLMVAKILFK